ncbi:hypothetical protein GCM10022224_001310 [Nonomuraea antimicrobica]|uniref:Histidine kinase/HSP90-like ATPase domain-containing protein n=1 Tax=Nonomuraea antimicrobica TaxID=561173 RepID=A0ABP7AYB7_9ACTN
MSAQTVNTQLPGVTGWWDTTLRRSARTPCQARHAVRSWLGDAELELLDSAALVVCELVTNVIRHVPAGAHRDWVTVRLGVADDFVRLEVIDPGTTTSEPRFRPLKPGSMRQSGRGLGLVAVLAVRYGTERLANGHRVVWADLASAAAFDTAVQEVREQFAPGRP